MHGEHEAEPVSPEVPPAKVPAGQSEHAAEPAVFANIPTAQSVQTEGNDAPVVPEYFPYPQFKHCVCPCWSLYFPLAQSLHVDSTEAPVELLDFPC